MSKRSAVADVAIEPQDQTVAIAEALDAQNALSPAPRPDETGWYSDANWITVECDLPQLKPRDGFAPITAEIDTSLTFKEAIAIPNAPGTPLITIFRHIAPRVRAWNVREWDAEAGAFVDVPPPAEIGTEAFMRCRPLVIEWLGNVIRDYSLNGGPNRKNGATPSDDGPPSTNGDG